jgi:hypothetical protein|tara:strand:+ start:98 stop:1537 length:1440 start_codon:yes stop_codon:yes gene_type:complete
MLKSKPVSIKYKDLIETYLNLSFLDKSFQVGKFAINKNGNIDVEGIDSRWPKSMQQEYLISAATGNAVTPLVIVDAEECFKNADSEEDKKYFKNILKKGFRYIVVDGWNRCVALLKFKNDLFDFPKVKSLIVNENYAVELPQSINHTTLKAATTRNERELFTAINNCDIHLIVVSKATRKEISNLFLRVNDGKTLNGAEKRNGIINYLADKIKNLSEKNLNYMKNLFSENEIIRLQFDNFIANCLIGYSYRNDKQTSDTFKMKMYKDETDNNAALKFVDKFAKSFTDFCKFISKSNTDKINTKTFIFYDLFVLIRVLEDKNIIIKDKRKFYLWFKSFVIKQLQSKKTYELPTGKNGDEEQFDFPRMLRKNIPVILQYRMNMYLDDLFKNLLGNEDVIAEYTPRENSYQKYRYELWEKQDGFDPASGESIPLHEILEEKYHVDHIKPLSRKGSNEITNLRLVNREFNLKKSNKLDSELSL